LWLEELSRECGRAVTLGEIPPSAFDRFAHMDAVWLLGVWERSPEGARVARELYRDVADIGASPYAVRSFAVEPSFGGEEGLRVFREELRSRGMRLLLDFIPNHVALDHRWTSTHPERFVRDGDAFAHGRDPFFPPWTDTLQLDYRKREVREAMTAELLRVAGLCDGVRCDMAMLVLRDVFCRTWGGGFDVEEEFWPAAIEASRRSHPGFVFVAEVYWGLEPVLQSMGFDFTYDKVLYDRLREGNAGAVREHIRTPQRHQTHFVENHDEDRAAHAFSPRQRHHAAATVALTLPGMRLIHDGQCEGRALRIPVQVQRRPFEAADDGTQRFYDRLLPVSRALRGEWQPLDPLQAWPFNDSHHHFVAFLWATDHGLRLVAVNLSEDRAQCYLRLGASRLAGRRWRLHDVLHDLEYVREGDELLGGGLYLDVAGHMNHLFELTAES
jgi:hypothetical protein